MLHKVHYLIDEKSKGWKLDANDVKCKISKESSWSTCACTCKYGKKNQYYTINLHKYGKCVSILCYYMHTQKNKIHECIRWVADTFKVKICEVKYHPCENKIILTKKLSIGR